MDRWVLITSMVWRRSCVVRRLIGWWTSLNPVWDLGGHIAFKIELLGACIAVSALFYVVAMWALKSEELDFLWGMVKRRGRR